MLRFAFQRLYQSIVCKFESSYVLKGSEGLFERAIVQKHVLVHDTKRNCSHDAPLPVETLLRKIGQERKDRNGVETQMTQFISYGCWRLIYNAQLLQLNQKSLVLTVL